MKNAPKWCVFAAFGGVTWEVPGSTIGVVLREESKVPHGEAIEELANWVRHNTVPEQLEGVIGNEQARAELAVTLHEVCGRDAQLRYLLTGLSRDPIAQLSALREAVMRAATTREPATADDAKAAMSGWSERERKLLRS